MYNRYVPQGDGSYRRNATPEPPRYPSKESERPSTPPQPVSPAPVEAPPVSPAHDPPSGASFGAVPKQPMGITSFFKNLLPRGFDTGDLLVVLLVLIMAGDCQEDQNTALLTLALYFFL